MVLRRRDSKDEMGKACRSHGSCEEYKALYRKTKGRRPLGKFVCTWKDNLKWILHRVSSGSGQDQ
jgi:hypothetical protein